jgi:ribose/xylose/arabinose/galactoside ABC-type transport system permease subunit
MSAIAVRATEWADWRSAPVSRRILRVTLLLFIALLLYGSLTTQGFWTISNLKAILANTSLIGIIAIGTTIVMISGNLFSITIGTTTALTAMFFLFALKVGVAGAIVLTLLLGLGIGCLQGIVVGMTGANPIIITLGAGALQIGFATMITGGSTVYPPGDAGNFSFLAKPLLGLPFAIYVFFGLAILAELMMRKTVLGREIFLMGENKAAARAAGMPIPRITTAAFGIGSVCAAMTGVLAGAFNQSATLALSGTFSFDAIAAALVGGSSVTGGSGSIGRTVFGALLIGVVSDLLLLRGYNTSLQILARGLIVLFAVVMVHLTSREGSR